MFKNYFLLFSIVVPMATPTANAVAGPASLKEAVTWLENESHHMIRASKRTMKDGTAAFPPQVGIGYEIGRAHV